MEKLRVFYQLPLKKNKDVNPTKASHHGLNPDLAQQAEQELA